MNKLVSVIIPLYNKETTINKCISSIINQSYKKIEMLVINDGSTDKSRKKLYDFKDERLHVFDTPNRGVSNARNYAISKAKGEYIVFVDADDYIGEHYIECLIKEMGSEVDYLVTGRTEVYSEKLVRYNINLYCGKKNDIPKEFYINGFCHPVWGKMFRKDIIDKYHIKFSNITISEDSVFNIDYLSHCSVVKFIQSNEYYYVHYGSNSLTGIFDFFYINIYIELYKKYKQFFMLNGLVDYSNEILYPQIYNLYLKMIKSKTIKEINENLKTNSINELIIKNILLNCKTYGFETFLKFLMIQKKWALLKMFYTFLQIKEKYFTNWFARFF